MISRIQNDIKVNKNEAVSKFWKEIEKIGTPIFEEIEGDDKYNLITFLVREDEEVENIVCFSIFVTEDIKEGLLERIEDTNIYFKSYRMLKGIRETYNFSKNNPLEPKDPVENIFMYNKDLGFFDSLNSKQTSWKVNGNHVLFNEIISPDAPPQPWYGERTNIDHGKIEEFTSYSEKLIGKRQILVYTPPNYSEDHSPYHFLLLFDGLIFEEKAKVSSTLDNLIADDKIPPVVAIMVENFLSISLSRRAGELPPNPKFVEYIVKELLLWVHKNYNISTNPSQSVVAGASYGGIASTFIAFKHPEIFSNVLSMSGSHFWSPGAEIWQKRIKELENLEQWWAKEDEKEEEWLARQFAQSERLPLKFYLDVGVLEDLLISNRHFRTVLQAKGYPVYYVEFLGGHDFVSWRGSIADGLIYLIGK